MTVVPVALVRACVRMQPRLEANESIMAVNRLMMGTGRADPGASTEAMRRWERAMDGDPSDRPASRGPAMTPAGLNAHGIGVRTVRRG